MKRDGFRNADTVLFPFNEGTKDFALEKGTKAKRGRSGKRPPPAQSSAERWDGSLELECWPFQDWDRSSLQDPSWLPWLGSEQAALSAA